ncbi:MAG: PAS domain-containing sensor histidine kinase [Candidatus Promineifilaceae bacterium]
MLFFRPPIFDDDNQTFVARSLYHILVPLFFICLGATLPFLLFAPETASRFLIFAGVMVPSCLGLMWFTRQGRTQLASILLITILWLITTLGAITAGGVQAPIFLGYVVVIFVTGFLLGSQAGIVATISIILSGIVMVLAERQGVLPPSVVHYSPVGVLIINSFFFVVVMMLQHLASSTTRKALHQTQQEVSHRRKSETRSQALLNAIPDMIFELDEDGTFLNFIPAKGIEPIVSAAGLIGRNIRNLFPPTLYEPILHALTLTLRENNVQIVEYNLPGPQGTLLDFEARLVAHDTHTILALVRDITTRKQAERERERIIRELEDKNSELERFTYTVSHDLKTPLVTIRGFLGYIAQSAAAGDMNQFNTDLQRIKDATNRMHHLLGDLLELSRIGRVINKPEPISFNQLVHEALELVSGPIESNHIQVILHDNLPTVYGDHQRLVEVLQNLLDNATKFLCPHPQPYIEIGQAGYDADQKPILFVRDNGIGIAPEYHEQIFGLFNKLDPQTEGTGIGLALVKRIIEVHNGTIWIESQPQQGATFFFSLPPVPPI